MADTMILKEEIDPDYEPTQEEIAEYAHYLGISLPEEKELLYIAKEGLIAPLPDDWKPCMTEEKEIFYFNNKTGQSEWTHPCDLLYKGKVQQAKLTQTERNPNEEANRKHETECEEILKTFEQQKKEKKEEITENLTEERENLLLDYRRTEHLQRTAFEELLENQRASYRGNLQQYRQEKIDQETNKIQEELRTKQLGTARQHEYLLKTIEEARTSKLKQEKTKLRLEFEEKTAELEFLRRQTRREAKECEDIAHRYAKKKQRILAETKDFYESELRTLEERHSHSISSQPPELLEFEEELSSNFLEELSYYKLTNSAKHSLQVEISSLLLVLHDKENILKNLKKDPPKTRQLEVELDRMRHILPVRSASKGLASKPQFTKDTLRREKEELKEEQKKLQIDREQWRTEMQEYKERPTEERRRHLSTLKRKIETKIQGHNDRVKDFRKAEDSSGRKLGDCHTVRTGWARRPGMARASPVFRITR